RSPRNNHIDSQTDKLGRELGKPVELPLDPPGLQHNARPFDVTQLGQLRAKGAELDAAGCADIEPAQPPRSPRRLSLDGERRGEKGGDEEGNGQPRHGPSRWPGCYARETGGSTASERYASCGGGSVPPGSSVVRPWEAGRPDLTVPYRALPRRRWLRTR